MSKILLISGREVDPFEMTIDDLDIMDIAHSLSMQCRYAGHIPTFYSVAEHCVRTVELMAEEAELSYEELRGHRVARSLLLHDADEAYLQDLVNPVKSRPEMEAYRDAGDRIHALVVEKYDCLDLDDDRQHAKVVKGYDKLAYEAERTNIRTGRAQGFSQPEAYAAFIGMWYLLRPSDFG